MTHPRISSVVPRLRARLGVAFAAGALALLPAAGPALAQTPAADWTQYQGGAAHPGSAALGPKAPLAVGQVTTFDDLPGGSSESLGLSAPVVSGGTVVVVGPTSVRAVSTDGGELWSAPRAFGPSVPAAISEGATGGVSCIRCQTLVLYTEGWGSGPGNPTSSATPTTSVRPGTSGSPASGSPSTSSEPTSSVSSTTASPTPVSAPLTVQDLMARNLADGSKAWDAPVQLKAPSRTGVTIDGATAFVGDIRGNVYAVDVATGKTKWTVNVNGFLESPLAASDGMVLVSVNGYGTNTARLVALSESTGDVSWVYDTGHPGYLTSPSIGDGHAFLGVTSFGPSASGSVPSLVSVALGGSGTSRTTEWESKLPAPETFATAPSVAGERVFVEDTFGDVIAIDRTTGARDWMFATNTRFAQGALLVVGDQVMVPTDVGSLIVLAGSTGHQVFRTVDTGGPLRYPAAAGGDRFLFTRGGPKPGLVSFTASTGAGALTDLPSPTTPNYGKLLGNFALAAAGIILVSLLVFRPLSRRMGPAFLIDEDGGTDPREEDA